MQEDYLATLGYAGLTPRLKRISDQILQSGRVFYKEIDTEIEPNWFLIFRILKEDKVSTITEISKKIKFAHPSVISIVKKMKANGYLEFAKNARDNRKQEIRLTKKAKQEFKKNEEIWLACEHAMASIFSNDTFLTELKKFEQAISKASFKKRAIKQLTINKVKCVDFKAKHKKAFKILNVNWLEKYFKVEPIDLKILDFPKAYIIDKKGKIFMAEIEGKAIGTVALIKYPKKPIELAKMAVDDDFQGLGIGHQLMEVAIAYCKEQKYKSVMLYTHKILKPAIHLYEKFGFKQVKLEPNSGYDRADYKMELKL